MSNAPPGPIIFIVDDDDAVRDSLTLLLGLRGYATRSFACGEDFLSAIDSRAGGCILLDLRLPGIDGLGVQAELAARDIRLPIIMLTAHGDVATARAALKSGAFDFLEKPIDDTALRTIIEAALSRDREVLEFIVQGRHNREMAAALGISPRTIEVYKARLMDKLQVDRLPDLIRLALDLGLSPGHD
jgi:FixJ family two-component response regulator